MTTQSDSRPSSVIKLLPHQMKFIEEFLASELRAKHHLISPTGMGRSTMVAGLIQRLITEQHAKRILILARSPLLTMYEHMLLEAGLEDVPVTIVDKITFRDLEVRSEKFGSPWRAPILAIMSIDIAKQEDISSSLFTVEWDLIVVDEFQTTTGQRRQFLDRFIQTDAIDRLLLLSTKTGEDLPPLKINGLRVTEWPREIRDWDGTLLYKLPDRTVRVIDYERSVAENAFIQKLKHYLDALPSFRVNSIERQQLLRAASSSLYAIESALRNRRNKLVHGDFKVGISKEEMEEDIDFREESQNDSRLAALEDLNHELSELIALFEELDHVQMDSKIEALRRVVGDALSNNESRIVIFTKFSSTASYLHTYLSNSFQSVYLVTVNTPILERADAVFQFRQTRSIVITSISPEGWNLGEASIGVSFDLPQSHLEMERRWSALGRFYNQNESIMYALRDKSGILTFEDAGLRKYGFISNDQGAL